MKWILPALLLLTACPLVAQKSEADLLTEAVRSYSGGNYETARSLFQEVLASNPKNQAAQNYLRMIEAKNQSANSLSASLKKIILPRVDLQDVSAREAITFVTQQVQKQTGGKQSVNVVWMVPEDAEKRVTLTLQDIPAYDALRYIGDAAGLDLAYDNFALKIKPAAPATTAATEPQTPAQP